VPYDFSAVADHALAYGLEMAQCLQYRVCLLHVHDLAAGCILNKEDAAYQKAFHDLLQCKKEQAQKSSVEINTLLRAGNLFTIINKTISEIKPRFVIMGTHGKQGLQHLYGSHALRVVLDAPCPVMVVHHRPSGNACRRLVVPVTSDTDPVQLTAWIMTLHGMCHSEVHLFQQMESETEKGNLLKGLTRQLTFACNNKGIPVYVETASAAKDFSSRLVDHANSISANLVLAMTNPAAHASGYDFSDWNERLMFNPSGIPVMFIDRTHSAV
jgi:nucleotide-binding universal stress UspA family protein